MKETLILTFHKKKNYGAALQTYALKTTLEKTTKVKILNFNFKEKISIKSKLMMLLKLHNFIKRNNNYQTFYKKYYNLTKEVNDIKSIEEECSKYDAIFCGSDQVWAFDIIKEYKDIYFLNFNLPKSVIRNSYAASIGKETISSAEKQELKKLIKNFDNISVREESAKKILNELGCEKATTSIDPTLLLTKEEYINNFNLEKKDDKYILVYMLEINDKIINLVKDIKEQLNLDIICFNNRNYFGKNCHCKPYSGPKEFLNLFYNADFIITNSFHGTCFSIIFEKQFITLAHTTKGTRQINLLEKANLLNRIYSNKNKIKYYIDNKINYKKVKSSLSKHIEQSINYINSSLGDEKK